jgi:16S rRNA processing protein RimM
MSKSRSSESRPWRPEAIVVGRIGRPHGLDGSVKLEGHGGAVPLPVGTSVTVGDRPAVIVERRGTDERPILRLDIASTREAAEAIRGADVSVPSSELPETDDDEYFHVDLIGCEVRAGSRVIGVVRTVYTYPANDVLEVESDAGTVLVPFAADVIERVDLDGRLIEVAGEFV